MPPETPALCGRPTCGHERPGYFGDVAHPHPNMRRDETRWECQQPASACEIHGAQLSSLPTDDVPLFKSEHLEIDPEQAALLKAEIYKHMPKDDVLAEVTRQRDEAVQIIRRTKCPFCDSSDAVYGGPPDEWCRSPQHAKAYRFLEKLDA